ncbi:MAG: hypothetical protein GY711_05215 [bacterium]|nr:hypothetical protein [bacterium]
MSAPGGAAGDLYGASVSLFDNLAVIGAPGSNVGPIESGSAWTHRRIGTTWSASGQFAPDDGVDGDLFGVVSTDGSRILIGSPEHDHVGDGAGSAYVFPVDTTIGMNYCGPAALNSAGLSAKILALGSARVADNNFSIRAIDMPPNQFGYIITGMNQGMAMPPGSDGFICMVGNIGRFDHQIGNSGAEGSFTEQLDLTLFPINPPTPVFVGDTYNFQVWFRDVGNRSNFTDGLTVTFE